MVRRLMLTSVPVALDTLAQSTIYVIAVSVVTLVFERECQVIFRSLIYVGTLVYSPSLTHTLMY